MGLLMSVGEKSRFHSLTPVSGEQTAQACATAWLRQLRLFSFRKMKTDSRPDIGRLGERSTKECASSFLPCKQKTVSLAVRACISTDDIAFGIGRVCISRDRPGKIDRGASTIGHQKAVLDSVAAVESPGHVAERIEATEKHIGIARTSYLLKITVVQQEAMGGKSAVEITADDTLPDNHGRKCPHSSRGNQRC